MYYDTFYSGRLSAAIAFCFSKEYGFRFYDCAIVCTASVLSTMFLNSFSCFVPDSRVLVLFCDNVGDPRSVSADTSLLNIEGLTPTSDLQPFENSPAILVLSSIGLTFSNATEFLVSHTDLLFELFFRK